MATNVSIAKNGSRVLSKILFALKKGTIGQTRRRIWVSASATPAVDAGASTAAAYPVAVGDLALRVDTSKPYVCTVSNAAATAATFVALQA
jgi:hypothetical protein